MYSLIPAGTFDPSRFYIHIDRLYSNIDYANWRTTAREEEDDSSSGCNAGILSPLFLLLLAPMGLLLKKSR